jgi:poly(3-hydroxybutyrate) depolymerase
MKLLTLSAFIVSLGFLAGVGTPSVAGAEPERGPEMVVPRSGLALANVGQSRRWSDRLDPVETIAIAEGLDSYQPQAGQEVTLPDGETRGWQTVELDASGQLDRQALGRGGYLYVPLESPEDRPIVLNVVGHGGLHFNGQPHTANIYGRGYYHVPVMARQGINRLLIQSGRGSIGLKWYVPPSPVFLLDGDQTLPDLVVGQATDTWGAVIVINTTSQPTEGLVLVAAGQGVRRATTPVPAIAPLSIRKVGFRILGPAPNEAGDAAGTLQLCGPGGRPTHQTALTLRVRSPHDPRKVTFVSEIDGSVQYYALRAAQPLAESDPPPAIVLSLHGASVEAIGQASSYSPKSWLHLVAPTNRRPYGFDWEDFGRADAMEVLELAKQSLAHDPARIYLTGHSMGGHGAWHVGSLFPDRFAAIGPSAGWVSYRTYARRRGSADEELSDLEKLLRRGEIIGDPTELAVNLTDQAVYILHGADDNNVPVSQARRMAEVLEAVHHDWTLHEEPGMGHWWSNPWDDGGATCVDWPPLFDQFARHALPPVPSVRTVQFATANPGVSSQCYWLAIEGQRTHHALSSATVHTWPNKRRLEGTTENVAVLRLDVGHLMSRGPITIQLDGQSLEPISDPGPSGAIWLARTGDQWQVTEQPPRSHKGPHRYGAIKNELRHRFLLVYGTAGNEQENRWSLDKARLDAETFWYRGNAGMDVLPDHQFDLAQYADRTVVLYGSADTNSAWSKLLADSPVQVQRNRVSVGDRTLQGPDLAVALVQPRPDSEIASVVAISATGPTGMRWAERQSLFVPFVRYPDCVVWSAGPEGAVQPRVVTAGYFGLDWSVANGEFVWDAE